MSEDKAVKHAVSYVDERLTAASRESETMQHWSLVFKALIWLWSLVKQLLTVRWAPRVRTRPHRQLTRAPSGPQSSVDCSWPSRRCRAASFPECGTPAALTRSLGLTSRAQIVPDDTFEAIHGPPLSHAAWRLQSALYHGVASGDFERDFGVGGDAAFFHSHTDGDDGEMAYVGGTRSRQYRGSYTLYCLARLLGEAEIVVEAAVENERNLLNAHVLGRLKQYIETTALRVYCSVGFGDQDECTFLARVRTNHQYLKMTRSVLNVTVRWAPRVRTRPHRRLTRAPRAVSHVEIASASSTCTEKRGRASSQPAFSCLRASAVLLGRKWW